MATSTLKPFDVNRRRAPRFEIPQIVPLEWRGEPAFILNVSEYGIALQTMEILPTDCSVRFMFVLPDSRDEISGTGRIAWSDRSGRAGLEFTDVPGSQRDCLRRWAMECEQQVQGQPGN
jgi:hypothetical protein